MNKKYNVRTNVKLDIKQNTYLKVSSYFVMDDRLCSGAKELFLRIRNDSSDLPPNQGWYMKVMNISEVTIKKYIKQLKDNNYLTIERIGPTKYIYKTYDPPPTNIDQSLEDILGMGV